MKRTKKIALHHKWMYGSCDCYHCQKYRETQKEVRTMMIEAISVTVEYNQFIFHCPTDVEGFMCDLADPCPDCPLLSDI